MNCQDFEEISDLYLDDELSVETTHAAIKHFDSCSNCREELAIQQSLNDRIKLAIKEDPNYQISQAQVENLLNRAREKATKSNESFGARFFQGLTLRNLIPAAGLLLLVLGLVIFVSFRPFDNSPVKVEEKNPELNSNVTTNNSSTNETLPATKIAWRELMTNAISEHEYCTLKSLRLEHNNITSKKNIFSVSKNSLEEIVRVALQKSVNKIISISESHICESAGKRYTHLIYKDGDNFISVMIANSERLTGSEEAMYCESAKNYQVACFTAKNQTVFVISNLKEPENIKLARSISPAVRQFLEQAKSDL